MLNKKLKDNCIHPYTILQMSDVIYKEFKPLGYCPTTMVAPNWLVHTLGTYCKL